MYTEQFHNEFESSIYFDSCKTFVPGKLTWYEWTGCSKSCGTGHRHRMASECIPSYAYCHEVQVKQERCNTNVCLDEIYDKTPPGSIMSWIPKPNSNAGTSLPIPDHWILCDGRQRCSGGVFNGQVCSDLSNRALIGTSIKIKNSGNSYDEKFLRSLIIFL